MSEPDKSTAPWPLTGQELPAATAASPVAPGSRIVFLLFIIAGIGNLAAVSLDVNPEPMRGWPTIVFLLLGTLATLMGLRRWLPPQNVIMLGVLVMGLSAGLMIAAAKSGWAFRSTGGWQMFGGKILGVMPWSLPLLWLVVVLNGRGVVQLILRPKRRNAVYGLWLIGLTSGLAAVVGMALESFPRQPPEDGVSEIGPVRGVDACTDSAAWFVVSAVLLVCSVPWLIPKRPTKQIVDYYPLLLWCALNLWLLVGNCLHRAWPAVGLIVCVNGAVLGWAIRGARCEDESLAA